MELSKTEIWVLRILLGFLTTLFGGWLLVEGFFLYGIIVCVVGIFSVFGLNFLRTHISKNSQRINNPDDFPLLNLPALKRNMKLIVENPTHPFNLMIQKIILYRGFDDQKYVLVIDYPSRISSDDSDLLQEFRNHWASPDALSDFIWDDFSKEIYKHESDAKADYDLENWMTWMKEEDEEIPRELASKECKWVLYKK